MSYPSFGSDVFPREMTHYRVPLCRPRMSDRTMVVFTVDWEKDHGRWRADPGWPDYGGIIRGTSTLCGLLDELQIPCTWLVECHSRDPRLDMPSACPEQLRAIADRPQDEIGLHIHWGNHAQPSGAPMSLYDRQWVAGEVGATAQRLARASGRSIVSFRSGGHTAVPGLPGILEELGFHFDASVEDRRTSWQRRLQAVVGLTTDAYHPDRESCLRPGGSPMWIVPTTFHLHDFDRLECRWRQWLPLRRQQIIVVYVHIDELTDPHSGRDDEAVIDVGRLTGLRRLLEPWKAQPRFTWLTARETATALDATRGFHPPCCPAPVQSDAYTLSG